MNLKPKLELGERSFWEQWLDKHNPLMALARTILGALNVLIATAICLKVFEIL
jgi:hypothetical protein